MYARRYRVVELSAEHGAAEPGGGDAFPTPSVLLLPTPRVPRHGGKARAAQRARRCLCGKPEPPGVSENLGSILEKDV
eukprot:scaffold4777_cov258-Pinguiococcus_pyrenoidosus.AAC.5